MARKVYSVFSALLLVLLVVQFFLGGLGVFTIFIQQESGQPMKELFKSVDPIFGLHFVNGVAIFVSLLVMLVFSFIARNAWRVTGVTALTAVLVFLQPMIAHTPFAALSALHIVNALVITALGYYLASRNWAFGSRGMRRMGAGPPSSEPERIPDPS